MTCVIYTFNFLRRSPSYTAVSANIATKMSARLVNRAHLDNLNGMGLQENCITCRRISSLPQANGEARMHAAVHLSSECVHAYQQLRSFGTKSAPERIARLILDWSQDESGMVTAHGIKISLTHDEIAKIVGVSRETATRTVADFHKRHIAELHGSTSVIRTCPLCSA